MGEWMTEMPDDTGWRKLKPGRISVTNSLRDVRLAVKDGRYLWRSIGHGEYEIMRVIDLTGPASGKTEQAIMRVLTKNGGSITHGILHNRLRFHGQQDVDTVIEKMLTSGKITMSTREHPYTKKQIVTYTPA